MHNSINSWFIPGFEVEPSYRYTIKMAVVKGGIISATGLAREDDYDKFCSMGYLHFQTIP
jgi:hypothetical protein